MAIVQTAFGIDRARAKNLCLRSANSKKGCVFIDVASHSTQSLRRLHESVKWCQAIEKVLEALAILVSSQALAWRHESLRTQLTAVVRTSDAVLKEVGPMKKRRAGDSADLTTQRRVDPNPVTQTVREIRDRCQGLKKSGKNPNKLDLTSLASAMETIATKRVAFANVAQSVPVDACAVQEAVRERSEDVPAIRRVLRDKSGLVFRMDDLQA